MFARALTTVFLAALLAASAAAQTVTWTGAVSGSAAWDANVGGTTNWSPNAVPPNTADVVFSALPSNGLLAVNLNGARTVNSFAVTTTFNWSFGGGTLTLTSGNFTRADTIFTEPDLLVSAGVVQGGNGTWAINGSNGVTVTGALTGSSSLTKTGAGYLSLESAETTFTGALAVNEGTVRVRNLGSISLASLSGTGAGTLDLGSTSVFVGAGNTSTTFAGTLTGSSEFLKFGTGTQTIAAAAGSALRRIVVTQGDLVFDGGSLTLTSGGSTLGLSALRLLSGSVTLRNGAVLNGGGADMDISPGTLLRVTGTGTALSSSQIEINGSAVIENRAALNSTTLLMGFGTNADVLIGTGAAVTNTGTVFIGASPTGAATLTVTDLGTTLAVNNLGLGSSGSSGHLALRNGAVATVNGETALLSATSSLTIDRASLETGSLATVGQGVTITNPAGGTALTIGRGDQTSTFGRVIVDGAFGPGGVSKIGTGTVTLTGGNTYTGAGTVSGGTLVLQGANRGSYTVTGAGALTLDGVNQQLGTGFLQADAGRTITYQNGTQVTGGFLNGPGTHAIGTGGATFSGTTAFAGAVIDQANAATLVNFTNEGTIANAAPLTWNGGTNRGAGRLSVTQYVATTGFANAGLITIAGGGMIDNATTNLVSSEGGRITIDAGGLLNLTGGSTLDLFGSRLTNNGAITGTTNVGFGALAKGTGAFGQVNVSDGGVFSPGASPGVVVLSGMTWGESGQYLWEVHDAAGAAGVAYDTLDITTGALDITAGTTPNSRHVIRIASLDAGNNVGAAINFDPTQSYTWVLAEAGSVNGFDPGRFTLNTADFENATNGGTFSIGQSGNQILLHFTPVPEAAGLFAAAGVGLVAAGRLRRKTIFG